MFKWLLSMLAFIFLAAFITSLTMNVFISSIDTDFDDTKASLKENSVKFAEQNQDILEMNESSAKQIQEIEALTPAQRKQALEKQCVGKNTTQYAFCDERFISGEMSFDEIIKENMAKQIETAQLQAFTMMNEKFSLYRKYPLILISIIAAILSLIFYSLSKGIFPGLQAFAGNISWLSFLSALSFKFMPKLINKLLGVAQKDIGIQSQALFDFTRETMLSWFGPAMNHAFIVTISVAIITFLIWTILKILKKYDVIVED